MAAKRLQYSLMKPLLIFLATVALAVAGCRATHTNIAAQPQPAIRPLSSVTFEPSRARLERGRYLSEGVLQCFVCHTDRDWTKPGAPPLRDMKGAGHIWGTDNPGVVAPNITPDKETGAGNWTDDMLARAIREGISHDGRVLDDQMYYASYRFLSDEDLASVIVYLRSLKPIRNPLPQTKLEKYPDPPAPLTQPVPEPDLSTPEARGRYLTRVGTCIGCHTAFFAPLSPGYFGGGDLIERDKERAFSANLTSDASGILSYYDESLFMQTLRTGNVKARKLSALMPWVAVGNMNDDDLKSIFAYLKTRRPVQHIVDNTEEPSFCPRCGQMHGYGDRNGPKDLRFTGGLSGSTAASAQMDHATLDSYAGYYKCADDWVFTITRDGDRLLIQNGTGGPRYQLFPIAVNEFAAKEIPEVISFVKNERGEVTHFVFNIDDLARRITSSPGTPSE
jgi:mono/diheme cytochrome c family protein